MDADIILNGPRLKVQRAHRHIDELITLTNPLSHDFFDLLVEENTFPPNAYPRTFELTYEPKQPIAKTLALVIGDTVHNLRGALDHLCTGIVRTIDPKADPHFPMCKIRKDLVAPNGGPAKTLAAIEKALPNATNLFLKKIRPENGPNEALWSFHVLDNDDKHNLLIPTVAVAKIIGDWSVGKMRFRESGGGGDADRRHIIVRSDLPILVQKEFETTVTVSFGKGGPFEDEAVIPTLLQVSQAVSETLDAFEALIRA